jgi:hypothetical protein
VGLVRKHWRLGKSLLDGQWGGSLKAMLSAASKPSHRDNVIAPEATEEFRSKYNKGSFIFQHNLAETGLFELNRIANTAKKMLSTGRKGAFAALNFKNAELTGKFSSNRPEDELEHAVENLSSKGTWIKLTRVQDFDHEYKLVLENIITQVEDMAGVPLRPDITWSSITLFLASPGIATPFHIDHESNFLFQIHGSKDVCLFDQNDREIVPDVEIENFYNGDFEAARYREEMQSRGTVFHLAPGTAVHHPPLAPHWVKNKEDISVSASVSFTMRPLEDIARIYQANFLLRRMGLNPRRPGISRTSDALKKGVMSMFEKKNADTYRDVVFGPMDRIKSPFKRSAALLRR